MRRQVVAAVVVVAAITLASGCSQPAHQQASFGSDQASFATPEEAVGALVAALEKRDRSQFKRLLGPETDALLSSGDAVADSAARESFLARYRVKHQLVNGGPNDAVLQVGEDDWPLPIPLVRKDGRWYLDGAAGAREIVTRRIGGNELRTINVMRGVLVAQKEYAAQPHDGAAAGVYAQTFRSEPGRHNGLYWQPDPGGPASPLGPLLAEAATEGYTDTKASGQPYHGYYYRMLASQGPAANGGARRYVVDGHSTGGFALLAWPVHYGASGVMTFLVNQDGIVWQRDLGKNTERVAASIQQFNPDSTWTPIPSEQ